MHYLLPFVLPLKGTVATPKEVRALAEITLPGVLSAREKYRVLADRSYAATPGTGHIPRPPLRDYGAQDWAAVLGGALIDEGDPPEPVDETHIEQVMVRADAQGREAERSQSIAYARNDPTIDRWARVDPTPPTCPFCTMLISRGPVYKTAKTAGGRNRFHLGCTCEVVLVTVENRTTYRGHELVSEAEKLWKEASTGRKGNEVPKRFRELVEERNGLVRKGRTQRAAESVASSTEDDLKAARVQLQTVLAIRPSNEQQRAYQQRAAQSIRKRIAKLETPGG